MSEHAECNPLRAVYDSRGNLVMFVSNEDSLHMASKIKDRSRCVSAAARRPVEGERSPPGRGVESVLLVLALIIILFCLVVPYGK